MRRAIMTLGVASLLTLIPGCESRSRRSYPARPVDPRGDRLEEPALQTPPRVTIEKTNVTFFAIVEEFRRQSDVSIYVDRVKDELPRMSFAVRDQPARLAIEAFARQAVFEADWLGPRSVTLRPMPRLWFSFKDADVRVVLDMIMRVSGANFILSPGVQGTITITVNGVPWKDVLDSVAATAGLQIIREDNGIFRILKA